MEGKYLRKELEFPEIDFSIMDKVKELIEAIAEPEEDVNEKLTELNLLTKRQHSAEEFIEYWGWTDLDILAQIILTPEPPYIRDLKKDEIVEVIKIIKECLNSGEDNKAQYYEELLHRGLSLPNVMTYVMSEEKLELVAEKMMEAASKGVILL